MGSGQWGGWHGPAIRQSVMKATREAYARLRVSEETEAQAFVKKEEGFIEEVVLKL